MIEVLVYFFLHKVQKCDKCEYHRKLVYSWIYFKKLPKDYFRNETQDSI